VIPASQQQQYQQYQQQQQYQYDQQQQQVVVQPKQQQFFQVIPASQQQQYQQQYQYQHQYPQVQYPYQPVVDGVVYPTGGQQVVKDIPVSPLSSIIGQQIPVQGQVPKPVIGWQQYQYGQYHKQQPYVYEHQPIQYAGQQVGQIHGPIHGQIDGQIGGQISPIDGQVVPSFYSVEGESVKPIDDGEIVKPIGVEIVGQPIGGHQVQPIQVKPVSVIEGQQVKPVQIEGHSVVVSHQPQVGGQIQPLFYSHSQEDVKSISV